MFDFPCPIKSLLLNCGKVETFTKINLFYSVFSQFLSASTTSSATYSKLWVCSTSYKSKSKFLTRPTLSRRLCISEGVMPMRSAAAPIAITAKCTFSASLLWLFCCIIIIVFIRCKYTVFPWNGKGIKPKNKFFKSKYHKEAFLFQIIFVTLRRISFWRAHGSPQGFPRHCG